MGRGILKMKPVQYHAPGDRLPETTVQLIAMEERKPIGWASAFVIKCGGLRCLVTALHAALIVKGVLLHPDPNFGIEVARIKGWGVFFDRVRQPESGTYCGLMDVAVAEISHDVVLSRYDASSEISSPHAWKIREVDIARTGTVDLEAVYSFCGIINDGTPSCSELNAAGLGRVAVDFKRIEGVRLVDDSDPVMLKFALPSNEGCSNVCFNGTSGAPVLDETGEVVAMVVSGSAERNEMSAMRFSYIWDLVCGKEGVGEGLENLKKVSLAPLL